MTEFDLQEFLRNYKPKVLDFKPYLKCQRLKGYKMVQKDLSVMRPHKTYVKFINMHDIYKNNKYDEHIHTGGILLAGGFFQRGSFQKSDDHELWTHLMLIYDPSVTKNKNGQIKRQRFSDPYVFIIRVSDKYIFYKIFRHDMRDHFRDIKYDLENMEIELV